jgi:hypothetical protein
MLVAVVVVLLQNNLERPLYSLVITSHQQPLTILKV